jgi:hypothetical protein
MSLAAAILWTTAARIARLAPSAKTAARLVAFLALAPRATAALTFLARTTAALLINARILNPAIVFVLSLELCCYYKVNLSQG